MAGPRVVAVLDSDPDTTEVIKTVLEIHGMVAMIGNLTEFRLGKASMVAFLKEARPDVIVYDLGVPYESNYQFLTRAREDPDFPNCGLVITTTNANAVQTLLGISAIEILGKPYDLDALVQAIKSGGAGSPDEAIWKAERRTGGDRRQDLH